MISNRNLPPEKKIQTVKVNLWYLFSRLYHHNYKEFYYKRNKKKGFSCSSISYKRIWVKISVEQLLVAIDFTLNWVIQGRSVKCVIRGGGQMGQMPEVPLWGNFFRLALSLGFDHFPTIRCGDYIERYWGQHAEDCTSSWFPLFDERFVAKF